MSLTNHFVIETSHGRSVVGHFSAGTHLHRQLPRVQERISSGASAGISIISHIHHQPLQVQASPVQESISTVSHPDAQQPFRERQLIPVNQIAAPLKVPISRSYWDFSSTTVTSILTTLDVILLEYQENVAVPSRVRILDRNRQWAKLTESSRVTGYPIVKRR